MNGLAAWWLWLILFYFSVGLLLMIALWQATSLPGRLIVLVLWPWMLWRILNGDGHGQW